MSSERFTLRQNVRSAVRAPFSAQREKALDAKKSDIELDSQQFSELLLPLVRHAHCTRFVHAYNPLQIKQSLQQSGSKSPR
jgi:hypothetical protein